MVITGLKYSSEIKARISVEAGVSQGWEKWVGDRGVVISIDKFGASAPQNDLYEHYGLTVDRVVETAKSLL